MKFKKQSKTTSTQLEIPVFFLDRTFGKERLAAILREAGFVFVTHFEEYGDGGHNLGDPAIIKDCGLKKRVLITGDQDLVYTWAKEIRKAKIAVFITTNNKDGPDKWGPRIIEAREDILRELGRRKKPFAGTISTEGRITQVKVFHGKNWKTITISAKAHKKPR